MFLENLDLALHLLTEPKTLLVILLAGLYGIFVGAIPGLTATMATALLVPVTFFLDPSPALGAIVMMTALAIFAGDIPATLVRIPGTPSSAAYTQDANELTKQGKAPLALGTLVLSASLGGLIGAVTLIIAAPILGEFALNFTTFEYFWLALLGLSTAVIISAASPLKGAISLLIGLLLSTVGIDITLGYARFTFGNIDLLGGVSFIPAMIGLFGLAEVLRNVIHGELHLPVGRVETRGIFRGVFPVIWRYRVNAARGGLIGVLVGILPGAGADIAAWLSYAVSKRFSKTSEQYGRGHIEPLVDCGTANNGGLAGAWIPALVFGIPGDSITAIVIGVLMMKGLRPGPLVFQEQTPVLYTVYLTFILANLLLIPLGYLAIRTSTKILQVRRNILMPAILLACIIGSYAINNTLFDVWIMLVMGILGFVLEANGFPVAPVVLGIVLGPILEENFMLSMIKAEWDLTSFFSRPISATLGVLTLLVWALPLLTSLVGRPDRQSASVHSPPSE